MGRRVIFVLVRRMARDVSASLFANGRDPTPTRVFWEKSVEVVDFKINRFFGDDKESVTVSKERVCLSSTGGPERA
jgi:hypothetical protein